MTISVGIFVIGYEFIGQTKIYGGVRVWLHRSTAFQDGNLMLYLHVIQGNVNDIVPHFDVRPHRAQNATDLRKQEVIKIFQCPTMSADMNTIEHIWGFIISFKYDLNCSP